MRNVIETIIGFFVIVISAVFVYFSYSVVNNDFEKSSSYALTANFDAIDGLKNGAEVKVNGITVGKVIKTYLDYENYLATVRFIVDMKLKLPEDSSVKIISSSIIGDKYLSITPGVEEKILKDGDSVEYTQSSVNLENLISKFLFGLKNSSDEEETQPSIDSGVQEKNEPKKYIFNDSENEVS